MTADQFHYLTPFLRALIVEQHKVEVRFDGEPESYWRIITSPTELIAKSNLAGVEFRIVEPKFECWVNVHKGDQLPAFVAFCSEEFAKQSAHKTGAMRIAVHMREVIEPC